MIEKKKSIENVVVWIIENRIARKYPVTRTNKSYTREWRGHNRLYKWGIAPTHTKSVDLNENNNIFEELIWLIIGGI